MIDVFCCCFRSLMRKRKRTILTALSIAIGVCSVVMISSLGNAGTALINEELDQLGLDGMVISCNEAVSDIRLDQQVCEAVSAMDMVDAAAGLCMETGKIRMHGLISTAVAWGVSSNYNNVMSIPLVYGRYIDNHELMYGKNVCLLDLESAKEFYRRGNIVGKTLSFECDGSKKDFEIVGIVKAGGTGLQNMLGEYIPSFLYIPVTAMNEITGKSGFSQISIKITDDPANMNTEAVTKKVEEISGLYGSVSVENLSKQNERLSVMLQSVTKVLSLIAAISLVVAAVGTMTVMISSVKERTREIGIKKSIGCTEKRIMLEYLIEAVMISAIGGIIGSTAAFVIVQIISLFIPIEITGTGTATLICVMLGTIFGVIPAKQASSMNPIESLRNE